MLDLLNKKWMNTKNRGVKISKNNGKLILDNKTNKTGVVCCTHLFKKINNGIKIDFQGKIVDGEAAVLELINKRREILADTTLNSTMFISDGFFKYYLVVIKVFPNTCVEIDKIDYFEQTITEEDKYENFNSDILVITPSYPSEEHKYLSGFVHSRVMEYKKSGINVDVAIVYNYLNTSKYEFEGIKATRMSYLDLKMLLNKRKYKKILVHFLDEKYYTVLSSSDLTETEVYFWVHGPETLHWDFPLYTTRYFREPKPISSKDRKLFEKKDKMLKEINEQPNMTFVFVSNWIKEKSEELIGIKFNNYEVIPNTIDVDLFKYQEKTKDKMKKIFMLRRYDDIDKYAVDVSVRTILELSKRDNFDSYEFNIYGNGEVFDKLFAPIMNFSNVHFHRSFYTHEEIADIHKENGIALFPTRYDAQGVSMCEAGSSGLLVISSDNDAIKEFIPSKDGNIIDTEDYKKYADFIEKVSEDEKLFKKITKETREKIVKLCSFDSTVKREIELIKKENKKEYFSIDLDSNNKKPILSVIIPSYNVSRYVVKTIESLIIGNKEKDNIEILVINDGSKDNTADIVREFIKKHSKKSSIVKLIDKENGGHGSTINVGIEQATGKYLRVVDGDDWLNTKDFEKLIQILKEEDSDIVLTNFSEELYSPGQVRLRLKKLYSFMREGYQYEFEDVCYKNYGFNNYGPILATANIKLDKLREANFKLSEKTFYVDMEYNTFYLPVIKTVSYYNLDIYRYFIGRAQQSVSMDSFVRNIDQHKKVINNILTFVNHSDMSELKKSYIYDKIAFPMIKSHYYIIIDVMRDKKRFREFDSLMKEKLPIEYYNNVGRKITKCRKTKGNFMRMVQLTSRNEEISVENEEDNDE